MRDIGLCATCLFLNESDDSCLRLLKHTDFKTLECNKYEKWGDTPTHRRIDHPRHYNHGKFEAIAVIEDWELGFNLGNTLKYIARADHKENKIQDLEKARWYLDREISNLKKLKKEILG